MATSVADLSIDVSANIASAVENMRLLGRQIGNLSDQFMRVADVGKSFINGLVGGLSVAAFTAAIRSSIDYADRLNDLAKSTGIAVETLGGLGYAAKQSGVDLDTVARGVQNLARGMAAAASGGNQELLGLFNKMGVEIKNLDGSLKPLDQTLFAVADKFKSYKDGPEKAALANEIFKKGGAQLIAMLNEGGDALRDLVAEYTRYSGVTTEVAQRSDAFNDTIEKVKLIAGGLFQTIASALLPTLQTLANQFVQLKGDGSSFQVVADGVSVAIKSMGIAAIGVIGIFKTLGSGIGAVVAALVEAAQGNFRAAWEILKQGGQDAVDTLASSITRAKEVWVSETATIASVGTQNLEKATAPLKAAKEKTDGFANALSSIQKVLRTAQENFSNYGREIEETSPSMKKLLDMMGSPQWAKFSEQQRQQIIDIGLVADAIDHETMALKRLEEQQKEMQEIIDRVNQAKQDRYVKDLQGINDLIKSMEQENAEMQFQISLIGLTSAEQEKLTAIRRIDLAVQRQINELSGEANEGDRERLRAAGELAKQQVATNIEMRRSLEIQQRGWENLFAAVTDRGAEFIEDFVKNGSSAFSRLWEDFKSWALSAFAKIAAQQIIVSIAGQFGVGGLGAAGGLVSGGGGGILDMLLGGQGGGLGNIGSLLGGGGGGLFAGLGNALGLGFGATSAFGPIVPTFGSALLGGISAPFATGGALLSGGAAAFGGGAAAIGATVGAMIPVIGIALAAAAAMGLFDKDPDETKGRISIRPPGQIGGFEDLQASLSKLGSIGFADEDTQQFSGEAGKILTDMVAGALDAFASRMDTEGQDRLAKILQSTTFQAFEGTFSTEDFIKEFGGDALKQVVEIAFGELDPALAAVVRGFSGTADEVANFSNALLSIYDVTRDLPEEVRANIIGALDATQETADKVLAFAGTLSMFGDVIEGLGPQLEALDSDSIIAFVDALGGAQQMAQSFAFLSQNFLTDADRLSLASEQLSGAFESIGLTVEDLAEAGLTSLPKTHAEFLKLLQSFDLTTDSGRQAYNAVLQLSQAFVAVNGTAEAAAQAVEQQAEANRQLIESATDFFAGNFYSEAEQAAQRVAEAIAEIDAAAASLGINIPRSIAGFRQLIESIDISTAAGQALYDALIVLAPAIFEVSGAVGDAASSFNSVTDSLSILQSQAESFMEMVRQEAQSLAAARLGAIEALAEGSGGTLGDQLALKIKLVNEQINLALADIRSGDADRMTKGYELLKEFKVPILFGSDTPHGISPIIQQLTKDLARFTTLAAQFDAQRAGQLIELEKWYDAQAALFQPGSQALAELQAEFNRRWDEIVKGISEGTTGTINELEKLRQGIADWLKGLQVSDLSPLKPLEKLDAARKQFEEQLAKALGGDPQAMADITKFADQYLRIARDLFKSSPQYSAIFDFITEALAGLAGTTTGGMPLPTVPKIPPWEPPAGWVPPPGWEFPLGGTDPAVSSPAMALVAAVPANGARLASSEDVRLLGENLGTRIEFAIAALADIDSEEARMTQDELRSVRRTIAATFEPLK